MMLTTKEIAEQYSPGGYASPYHAWAKLLQRCRDKELLKEGVHFQFRQPGLLEYDIKAVLTFVRLSDAKFACAVRIAHGSAIRTILTKN